MEFDFVIEKAVTQGIPPKNTFRVDVEFMHGDADGETHAIFNFPSNDPNDRDEEYDPTLNELMTYLSAFFSLEWNDGCRFCQGYPIKRESLTGVGLSNEAIDRVEEAGLWEGDITCEGHMARPMNATVTYFNEFGVEHYVNVFNKGTNVKPKMVRN